MSYFIEPTRSLNSFTELLARPDQTLEKHLVDVANMSKEIVLEKHLNTDTEILANISFYIGLLHDFAKGTNEFQKYIRGGEPTEKARHGLLGAVATYIYLKDYIKIEKYKDFDLYSFLAVYKHHGNLPTVLKVLDKLESRIDFLKEQVKDLQKEELVKMYSKHIDIKPIIEILDERMEETVREITLRLQNLVLESKTLESHFMIRFLFSILIDVDKLSASKTPIQKRVEIPSNLITEHIKQFDKEPEVNQVRTKLLKEVGENVQKINLDQKLFDINTPTGSAKTFAVVNFALKMRERIQKEVEILPKIIYLAPTISIIDQIVSITESIFGKELVTPHHHLADYEPKEEDELNYSQKELLVESWRNEFIVSTFAQFFHSLISGKNKANKKFHNITNSIIILDEIQNIPYKYWLLVQEVLEFLTKNYNCWIILMSATKPKILETHPLIKNPEEYFRKFNRYTLDVNLEKQTMDDFLPKLCKEIEETEKSFMVVLNTKNACVEAHEYLKNFLGENVEIEFLTTSLTPHDRLKRIQALNKERKEQKILITTQLIEAGVDITFPKVYRDFAPLDSIVQTSGRCERHHMTSDGIVKIVYLEHIQSSGRKVPYSSYIYGSILRETTLENLESRKYSEKDAVFEITKKFYESLASKKSNKESRDILRKIINLSYQDLDFSLIDDGGYSVSILIENEEIEKEIKTFEKEVDMLRGFERYNFKKRFIRKLQEHMVNLRIFGKGDAKVDFVKNLPTILNTSVRYIPLEFRDEYYDAEIGLTFGESFSLRLL